MTIQQAKPWNAPGVRERRERERALLSEPDFIDHICDEVACTTNTLSDIARHFDIRYHELHSWVHNDADRLKKYAEALEARNSNLQDRVLRALLKIAEFDIRDLYDEEGHIKDIQDMPDHVARVISSLEMNVVVGNDGKISNKINKVKLADRMRGLEGIGRHAKMFTDKVEVDNKAPTTIKIVRFGDDADKPA